MVETAFWRRAAVPGPRSDADPPQQQAGRLLLRRVGISGAVIAIIGVSAACVGVFVVALYATSLAF